MRVALNGDRFHHLPGSSLGSTTRGGCGRGSNPHHSCAEVWIPRSGDGAEADLFLGADIKPEKVFHK